VQYQNPSPEPKKTVHWKEPLEEIKIIQNYEENNNTPKYVLNIIYNNNGIYFSKRSQQNKEMFSKWQSPGGKVKEDESSEEAALRETKEETGIQFKLSDPTYLFNDPQFDCDVYITKLASNQISQQTEPEKQGPWIRYSFQKYEQLAQNKETTPTHTTYYPQIVQVLKGGDITIA